MAKIYGYARCSTDDSKQDIGRQTRELSIAGAEPIFYEYEHGTAEHKAELEKLLAQIQPGDTLIVTEISRLSRSTKQLCELVEKVQRLNIKLEVLNSITIDCRNGELDPMTKAFLQMSGVFAELERSMICERVKSGIANAKAKGVKLGRPERAYKDIPAKVLEKYPLYKSRQISMVDYANICGLARGTMYSYVKLIEQR